MQTLIMILFLIIFLGLPSFFTTYSTQIDRFIESRIGQITIVVCGVFLIWLDTRTDIWYMQSEGWSTEDLILLNMISLIGAVLLAIVVERITEHFAKCRINTESTVEK